MSALMPKCYRPIKFSDEPKNNAGYWDRAFEFYEAGEYRNSLLDTINYINPNILKDKDLDAEITSNQPHGSAVIAIKITNEEFSISAPFLKTTNANKVALMRRVCEVNFSDLTLTQIFLKNDSLWFYFKSPLKLCHPTKIYDVIREVCVYADDYDDEFIQQYNADYFIKPKITQLSAQQQEKVWSDFQEIATQYREYLGEFEQKRWLGSVWDIMAITMLNVSNMPYVHGTLRTDLERAIGMHYDGNLDGNYRIDQTKAYLNKLFNNTPKETFLTNIYQVKKLFSVRYRCTTEILMSVFDQNKEGFIQDLNSGNGFSAAYALKCFFLKLIYDFNLDESHEDLIYSTLEQTSNKDINDAVPILWDTYNKFLTGSVQGGPKKTGFFSKLLGKG